MTSVQTEYMDIFSVVTRNLLSLGSCPLYQLVESSDEKFQVDLRTLDLPFLSSNITSRFDLPPTSSSGISPTVKKELPNATDDQKSSEISMRHVAQLHETCQQTFGNADALKFEFIEEEDHHKKCILTITRPNGVSRSYSSPSGFKRKSDAKAHAAKVALELGANDFIVHGIKDRSRSHTNAALVPLDAKASGSSSGENGGEDGQKMDLDDASKQIQDCCIEWRAGLVEPRWFRFSQADGSKGTEMHGCALSIELSPHVQRVCSVKPTHPDAVSARAACSSAAIQEGILDFIKFGNGQTAPASRPLKEQEQVVAVGGGANHSAKPGRAGSITLHEFFESLPKPFPESRGAESEGKPSIEVNAPGVLNTILQGAKGARFSVSFHNMLDTKTRLHGCLLRLERPSETRTYIVEPKFAKRADAKSAVCLQAFSQGVGSYIREVAAKVENQITSEMRKLANEKVLPVLGTEYSRVRAGVYPNYEFQNEQGAFGCTLTLQLSKDAPEEEARSWTVPTEYKTKADAKIAVVCKAGREAIEFVRFRGGPVPEGHDAFQPYRQPKEKGKEKEKAGGQKGDEATKPVFAIEGDSDGKSEPMDLDREGSADSLKSSKKARDSSKKKHQSKPGVASGLVKLGVSSSEGRSNDNRRSDEGSSRTSGELRRFGETQRLPSGLRITKFGPPPIPPPPRHPTDISAAATAVIDRLTSGGPQVKAQFQSQPPQRPPPSASPNLPSTNPAGWSGPPPSSRPAYPYHANAYHPYPPPPPAMHGYPPYSNNPPPAPGAQFQPAPNYHPPHLAPYPQNWHQPPAPVVPPPQAPPFIPAGQHSPPNSSQPAMHLMQASSSQGQAPSYGNASRRDSSSNSEARRDVPSAAAADDRRKRARSPDDDRHPGEGDVNKKRKAVANGSGMNEASTLGGRFANGTSASASGGELGGGGGVSRPRQRTNVDLLYDYCDAEKMGGSKRPVFSDERVSNADGTSGYKVWVVMGTQRLELPLVFKTVDEGKERLAKQVLQRLKSLPK